MRSYFWTSRLRNNFFFEVVRFLLSFELEESLHHDMRTSLLASRSLHQILLAEMLFHQLVRRTVVAYKLPHPLRRCLNSRSRVIPRSRDQDFPEFENPSQVLYYSGNNAPTLSDGAKCSLLQVLGDKLLQSEGVDIELLSEDASLQKTLKTVAQSCLSMSCSDGIVCLQGLCKIKEKLSPSSTIINDTASPLLKRLVRGEFAGEPDQVASLTFWLIEAGILDLSLPKYLQRMVRRIHKNMSFAGVRTMLRALNKLNLCEPNLIYSLTKKLTSGVGKFSNEDVIDTFRLDFETGIGDRRCCVQLTEHVIRNIKRFSVNEVVELFSVLCSLRHLSTKTAIPFVQLLQSHLHILSDQQILQVNSRVSKLPGVVINIDRSS